MQMLDILADGAWHSGEELADAEGISRAAVWQRMQSIRELGLEVFAVRGRGYRLREPLDRLDETVISTALASHSQAMDVVIHQRTDSTNSQLMAADRLPTPRAMLAEYQEAGRGRRGRNWQQPYASGLSLSLGWDGDAEAGLLGLLPMAAGLAIVEAFTELGCTDLALKWPNDIYARGNKLGGVLIEHRGELAGLARTVIGVGLNVRLPDDYLLADGVRPACLDEVWPAGPAGSALPSRSTLAAVVIQALLSARDWVARGHEQDIVTRWRQHDLLAGQQVQVISGEQRSTGVYAGVADDGALLLDTGDGQPQVWHAGDVSLRPLA